MNELTSVHQTQLENLRARVRQNYRVDEADVLKTLLAHQFL